MKTEAITAGPNTDGTHNYGRHHGKALQHGHYPRGHHVALRGLRKQQGHAGGGGGIIETVAADESHLGVWSPGRWVDRLGCSVVETGLEHGKLGGRDIYEPISWSYSCLGGKGVLYLSSLWEDL